MLSKCYTLENHAIPYRIMKSPRLLFSIVHLPLSRTVTSGFELQVTDSEVGQLYPLILTEQCRYDSLFSRSGRHDMLTNSKSYHAQRVALVGKVTLISAPLIAHMKPKFLVQERSFL